MWAAPLMWHMDADWKAHRRSNALAQAACPANTSASISASARSPCTNRRKTSRFIKCWRCSTRTRRWSSAPISRIGTGTIRSLSCPSWTTIVAGASSPKTPSNLLAHQRRHDRGGPGVRRHRGGQRRAEIPVGRADDRTCPFAAAPASASSTLKRRILRPAQYLPA